MSDERESLSALREELADLRAEMLAMKARQDEAERINRLNAENTQKAIDAWADLFPILQRNIEKTAQRLASIKDQGNIPN